MLRMGELDADRGKGLATFDVININPDTEEKFKNGAEQAEYLKYHSRENSGVIIDSFITELVKDPDTYIRGIKSLKDEWIKQLNRTTVQPEIDRMIKKLSTIYATGVTASVMGILPYKKEEILEYLNSIFENWLNRRGGDVSYELNSIIKDLYKLCIFQQHARFTNAYPKDDERYNLVKDHVGFYKMENEELKEFWLRPRAFDNEVLKGRDKRAFISLLVKNNFIIQGNDKKHTQIKRPKNEPSQRFYIVPVDALLDEVELTKKSKNSY